MPDWYTLFDGQDIGRIQYNVSLASFTTWKIGGPADVLAEPETLEQLQNLLKILDLHQVPWVVLGRGSNVLVSDEGIRNVVIHLTGSFEQIRFDGDRVIAGAAYSLIKLASLTAKEGLSGLEFAGGIPATVGGAVYMNAGAHGSDFSAILEYADGVLADGSLIRWSKEELDFSYRHSALHGMTAIVTGIGLQLRPGDRKQIAADMANHKSRRLQTQPLMLPCCGSVFRNPLIDADRMYAAQLIERAGFKGFRLGGAQVSELHANFIINTGDATAQDTLRLIHLIRQTIFEKYDVLLEPEVRLLGHFPGI